MPHSGLVDGVWMAYPESYLSCEIEGVKLERISGIRERGHYIATALESNRRYTVQDQIPSRNDGHFHWLTRRLGKTIGRDRNIVAAAKRIARHEQELSSVPSPRASA